MSREPAWANCVRRVLARRRGISERRMFGGTSFLAHGNMYCGAQGDRLIPRTSADTHAAHCAAAMFARWTLPAVL